MFPIFPNFTVVTMCIIKYVGTILFRKGAITLWKSTRTMSLRKYARQCLNTKHTLSYITRWCWIELVKS